MLLTLHLDSRLRQIVFQISQRVIVTAFLCLGRAPCCSWSVSEEYHCSFEGCSPDSVSKGSRQNKPVQNSSSSTDGCFACVTVNIYLVSFGNHSPPNIQPCNGEGNLATITEKQSSFNWKGLKYLLVTFICFQKKKQKNKTDTIYSNVFTLKIFV